MAGVRSTALDPPSYRKRGARESEKCGADHCEAGEAARCAEPGGPGCAIHVHHESLSGRIPRRDQRAPRRALIGGHRIVAIPVLPKHETRVRFPLAAPELS